MSVTCVFLLHHLLVDNNNIIGSIYLLGIIPVAISPRPPLLFYLTDVCIFEYFSCIRYV